MKAIFLTVVLCCFISVTGFAAGLTIGEAAPGFTLKDLAGQPHKLADSRGKLTIVAFLSAKCPISNAYTERIRALAEDYAKRDVVFLAINASADESASEIKAHAAQNGFAFPILKDKDNRVADAYGAVRTPEIYLVDGAGILRYHGRIDNHHLPMHVKTHDLRNALDELLAGRPVTTAETKALGCIIKRAGDAKPRVSQHEPQSVMPSLAFGFAPQKARPAAKRPAAKSAAAPAAINVALLKPAALPKLLAAHKGQVVVLNFWATWCAPCVAEMPEFVRLHNEYKDKGVKIIAISADDTTDLKTQVVPFVRTRKLPFAIYVQDTDDPQQMIDLVNKDWPGTLPSTFVYDKTGQLIYSRFAIIERAKITEIIEQALKN